MKVLKIWELVLIPRKVVSSGSTWHIAGFPKDLSNNENTESTIQSSKLIYKQKEMRAAQNHIHKYRSEQ